MMEAEGEHSPVLLSEPPAQQGCAWLQLKCHTMAPHSEQTLWPGALICVSGQPKAQTSHKVLQGSSLHPNLHGQSQS